MAEIIRMPRMSDTMTEAVIVAWHKKIGDTVKSGDLLAEVETDKATMELESYQNGVLLYIGVDAGKTIAVNGVLAILGKAGEDYKAILDTESSTTATAVASESIATPAQEVPVAQAEVATVTETFVSTDSRLKASPLAKKIAIEKGVDLKNIKGSGENGRIVKADLENANSSNTAFIPAFVATGKESFTDFPLSQMRKTIARRLSESMYTAPHFYLTMSIHMDQVVSLRKSLNEVAPVKVSYNDIVMKAVALSLVKNPKVNASWLGDKIRLNHHVHLGMAVAIEDGLIVPVVRFAHEKSVLQIAAETKQLAEKAKNKQLQPSDWEGNTFTISNLGMMDIDEFTAIINPPDACILAIGAIKEKAISVDGQIRSGQVMKVTLSCDHRVVDGAVGSAFLQDLKKMLENPISLFL